MSDKVTIVHFVQNLLENGKIVPPSWFSSAYLKAYAKNNEDLMQDLSRIDGHVLEDKLVKEGITGQEKFFALIYLSIA